MKAQEANSDRKAEIHLYVQGSTVAVDEYGEYVDADDGAICCFVPVDEGAMVKAEGRFWGTTMEINSDVYVDGICRMACRFVGTAVSKQSSRKLCHDNKYLFRTPDGIIESPLVVEHIPPEYQIEEKAPISVGTIEVRVYVLRSFGEKHRRVGPAYYDYIRDGMTGTGGRMERRVGYKTIKPEFVLMHQPLDDCQPLDDKQIKKYSKAMDSDRVEPWATFRFHYRTLDSILEAGLPMTCKAGYKKAPSSTLTLEQASPLALGSKPGKGGDGEDASTRQSSVAPSVGPCPSSPANAPSTPKPCSSRRRLDSTSPEKTSDAIKQREATKTSHKTTVMETPKTTIAGKADSLFVPAGGDLEDEEACEMYETSVKEERNIAFPVEASNAKVKSPVNVESAHKESVYSDAAGAKDDDNNILAQKHSSTSANTITPNEKDADTVILVQEECTTPVPFSHDSATVFNAVQDMIQPASVQSNTVSTREDSVAATTDKDEILHLPNSSKEIGEPTADEEVAQKPTVAANTLQISIQKNPATPIPATPEPGPLTPTKRPIGVVLPSTPTDILNKRSKLTTESPAAIERKNLAEIRRQLAALKTQREETARKRKEAEAKAAPYLQRLAEEREELEKELAAEKKAFESEQDGLEGVLEVLKEFEGDDMTVEMEGLVE